MAEVSVYTDLDAARDLWQRHWPQDCIFDLWEVRACFQAQFNHSPYFLVASREGEFCGMLALSWIEEGQCYGHFPGEVWQGKTWLEQNKIIARDPETLHALLNRIPEAAKVRYLIREPYLSSEPVAEIDEVGYLFFPQQYDYSFEAYRQSFSGKSRKKLRVEMDRLKAGGVSFRHNCVTDIAEMFRMNLEGFRELSYFSDLRFLRSFENLVAWLNANELLRVTTVLIGGKVAAVDVGAVWGATYTVLAGGTHPDFPGVAKLINFHHIEWACEQRLSQVDFLCGDFNWKKRFHLTERPLFKLLSSDATEAWQEVAFDRRAACAG